MNDNHHRHVGLEYEQINENIRFLADVRFKLLALIPLLGGAATFILAQRVGLQAGEPVGAARYELLIVVVFALLGFLATLGITLYDQRNSELYNALLHRAAYLEKQFCGSSAPGGIRRHSVTGAQLRIGGQYRERPKKNRRLIFQAGHDFGLALIYGPVLGAWVFPMGYGLARIAAIPHKYALVAALLLAGAAALGLVKRLKTLDENDKNLYHEAATTDHLEEDS